MILDNEFVRDGSKRVGLLFLVLTMWAGLGPTGFRFRSGTAVPFFLHSRRVVSLRFTRSKKSCRQLECLTCSALMQIFFFSILFLTGFVTTTPKDRFVTLNTRPVRPW